MPDDKNNAPEKPYQQALYEMIAMIDAAHERKAPKINDVETVPLRPNALWEYHTEQMRVVYREKAGCAPAATPSLPYTIKADVHQMSNKKVFPAIAGSTFLLSLRPFRR